MKLSKILTVVAPVAIVGTIVPSIVSCGGNGTSFNINYGDEINCLDKTAENYHSLSDIKSAAKVRASKMPRQDISESALEKLNNEWSTTTTTTGQQKFYFDLIASISIVEGKAFHLTWHIVEGDTPTFDLQIGDETQVTYTNLAYTYIEGEEKFVLIDSAVGEPPYICNSYALQDCTYKGE